MQVDLDKFMTEFAREFAQRRQGKGQIEFSEVSPISDVVLACYAAISKATGVSKIQVITAMQNLPRMILDEQRNLREEGKRV